MTEQQKNLLTILRTHLNGEKLDPETLRSLSAYTKAAWDAFLTESIRQNVILIVCEELAKYGLPNIAAAAQAYQDAALQVIVHDENVIHVQRQLCALLDENQIPHLILKGTSASASYPDPTLRSLGDIDVLLAPNTLKKAESLLLSSGGEAAPHGNRTVHRAYTWNGEDIELHFSVSGIPGGKAGIDIRAYFKDIQKRSITQRLRALHFPAASIPDQALIMLLHLQKHLQTQGLGLRHLFDWAAFCKSHDGAFWWTTLCAFLKEIGLYRFASAITATCEAALGTSVQSWREPIPAKLTDALTADIFAGGEFGRKNNDRARAGALLTANGQYDAKTNGIRGYFGAGVSFVKSRYPVVSEEPWRYVYLYPWCGCIRVGRVLSGKRPNAGVMYRYAQERGELYTKLAIFSPEPKKEKGEKNK